MLAVLEEGDRSYMGEIWMELKLKMAVLESIDEYVDMSRGRRKDRDLVKNSSPSLICRESI